MTTAPTLNPNVAWGCRLAASASLALGLVHVANNFLTYGFGLAGPFALFSDPATPGGIFQLALVATGLGAAVWFSERPARLVEDAAAMEAVAAGIISAAFWAVLLLGLVDAAISFLRVEGLHVAVFGQELANRLGIPSWRGTYVHLPIIAVAVLLGLRGRTMRVAGLGLLVVLAELVIVVSRFVFSYEQTFMGDLVRFWYAALFLFASARALREEGHVRVDVFYEGMGDRARAWVNATGAALFGIPLCWVILWRGLAGKSSLINSPVLSFEISMSGFSMYVKYLMAAFLLVFALSMLAQFAAMFLRALSVLGGETTYRTGKG